MQPNYCMQIVHSDRTYKYAKRVYRNVQVINLEYRISYCIICLKYIGLYVI